MHLHRSDHHRLTCAYIVRMSLGLVLLALLAHLAPTAQAASKIPADNVVSNPTFKQGKRGWAGIDAKLNVIRDRKAPDGRTVAQVKRRGKHSSYAIDDRRPAAGPTTAGATYRGTAYVKAGGTGQRVALVLRETTPEGAVVGETSKALKLSKSRFKSIKVKRAAEGDGNSIDVSVKRLKAGRAADAFFVDAITVRSDRKSSGDTAATGAGALTTSQIAFVSSQEDPLFVANGSKYRYIVIRDSMSNRIEELRAAHPEADILLYKDVSFTIDQDDCQWAPLQGTGVSFCAANPHESWFLHRKGTSQRLLTGDYDGMHAMNLADPGFQQEWSSSVMARLADAKGDGSGVRFDGVWMDDTNLFPGHGIDGQIAEMSDEGYRNATVDFIDKVGPQLQGAGFQAVPNLGMAPWDGGQRAAALDVARDVTAINREGLVRWGPSGNLFTTDGGTPVWLDEVEFAEDVQAAGADLQAITYGTAGDVRGQRYSRATFLMAWDGSDGASLSYRTDESGQEWQPDWTIDVGAPAGPRRSVGRGYMRSYSAGVVAINPSSSGSQTFTLGGSYRDPDSGSCVTSMTLGATRALVMPAC